MTPDDPESDYVSHPSAEGAVLAEIAGRRPDLQAAIARHPNAYEALLDWIAAYGTSDARAAVSERRAPTHVALDAVPASAFADRAASAHRPVSVLRRRGVLIGAIVGVVVMAAGGVGIAVAVTQSADRAAVEAEAAPTPGPPEDCDSYLALSAAEREAEYAGRTHRVFGATGVTDVPVTVAYDAGCPAHAGESYLLDNLDSGAEEPSCRVFLTLTPDQRAAWIPLLSADEYWQLSPNRTTVDELSRACTELALPVDNMVRLSSYLSDLTHYMSWSTQTRLGYSWNAALGVGEPQLSPEEVGGDTRADGTTTPRYMPGTACGFDADTDAIIPLSLLLTSTTGDGQRISLAAHWSLQVEQGAKPVTQAYLEANYSDDGPVCSRAANGVPDAELGVQFREPENEAWSSESYWVILKNWRSPRFPDGATPELSAYVLVGAPIAPDADDPVVNVTAARMRLDGVRE